MIFSAKKVSPVVHSTSPVIIDSPQKLIPAQQDSRKHWF